MKQKCNAEMTTEKKFNQKLFNKTKARNCFKMKKESLISMLTMHKIYVCSKMCEFVSVCAFLTKKTQNLQLQEVYDFFSLILILFYEIDLD